MASNNPNPLIPGGSFTTMVRSIFNQPARRLSGTRAEGAQNPFQNLAGAMAGRLGGGDAANPFAATAGLGAPPAGGGGGVPGVHDPYAGGGAGGGLGGGMSGTGGATTSTGGGGLAPGGATALTSGPFTGPLIYPNALGPGYSGPASSTSGAGIPIPFMSAGQLAAHQQALTQAGQNNPLAIDPMIDPFAWTVARAAKGYPPGSVGQVHGGWWSTPDGIGPNGEPAFYTSDGAGIIPGYADTDTMLSPAEFLAKHPDWVQGAIDDPSIFNNPSHPIWQHVDPGDLQAAIALLQNGGGGTGGTGTGGTGGGTGGTGTGGTGTGGTGTGGTGTGGTGGGTGGGGGGVPGPKNASGGKKGDHKNTGPGGGQDKKKKK